MLPCLLLWRMPPRNATRQQGGDRVFHKIQRNNNLVYCSLSRFFFFFLLLIQQPSSTGPIRNPKREQITRRRGSKEQIHTDRWTLKIKSNDDDRTFMAGGLVILPKCARTDVRIFSRMIWGAEKVQSIEWWSKIKKKSAAFMRKNNQVKLLPVARYITFHLLCDLHSFICAHLYFINWQYCRRFPN